MLKFQVLHWFLLLWICLYVCLSHNCWLINVAETWGTISIFLFSLFLPNSAYSESDITQESPFTSADTGDSRSAFPSYAGTGISTEGSSDFSWGYGVSCMLLVWWSIWEIILGVRICQYFSFLHSPALFLYILILKFTTLYNEASKFTLSVCVLFYRYSSWFLDLLT